MATISDMGIPLTGTGGIIQPHHKHRWQIAFINMGGDSRMLTSMAISAERPKLAYEPIQLDRYNSRAWIFGKHTFQPITVTLEPDVGGRVHQAIVRQSERQQRLIAPTNGAFHGQAAGGQDYKFSMIMQMLDGDHSGTSPLETWKIEGCGLENLDFGDVDYASSETLKTMLTVRYDHARLEVTGKSKDATGGSL